MYYTENMNLGVINDPDSLGPACNFQPYSFYLGGKRTYFGLPNNPDYGMGPLIGSGCDSLVAVEEPFRVESPHATLHVFYHPIWKKLFINAQHLQGHNIILQVFDLSGQKLFSSSSRSSQPYFTEDVDVSFLNHGIYIISLTTESENLTGKFFKE